jgi:protein TonB
MRVEFVEAAVAPTAAVRAPEMPDRIRHTPVRKLAAADTPMARPDSAVPPPQPSSTGGGSGPLEVAQSAPAAEAQPAIEAPAPSVPRTIPPTAVQYLVPPAPVYPERSRRLGESGHVVVRVEIDADGRARQVQVLRSSGIARLDEAALAAVRAARFKPYTENGVPLSVWTAVPVVFELEN